MQITHNATTALAAATHEESSADLAGARFRKSQRDGEPDVWVAVPIENAAVIYDDDNEDRKPHHVLGSTEEQVLAELQKRFPRNDDGGSLIYRVEDFSVSRKRKSDDTGWSRRYHDEWVECTIELGWVRLPHPYFHAVPSVERLRSLSEAYGPVMLAAGNLDDLLESRGSEHRVRYAEDAGFVVRCRERYDLWSANYNPTALLRRAYRGEEKEYGRRAADDFPDEVLWQLFATLSPGDLPYGTVGRGVIKGPDLTRKTGWANVTRVEFSTHDVMACLDVSRRLAPGSAWWRTSRSPPDWRANVRKALEHVHGVERAVAVAESEWLCDQRRNYNNWCDRVRRWLDCRRLVMSELAAEAATGLGRHDLAEFEEALSEYVDDLHWCRDDHEAPAATFEQHLANPDHARERANQNWFDRKRLCRFLRAEARALGLSMPSPPVKPPPFKAWREWRERRQNGQENQ